MFDHTQHTESVKGACKLLLLVRTWDHPVAEGCRSCHMPCRQCWQGRQGPIAPCLHYGTLLWLASAPADEWNSFTLLLALTACSSTYVASVNTAGLQQAPKVSSYLNETLGSKSEAKASAAGVKCVSDVEGNAQHHFKPLNTFNYNLLCYHVATMRMVYATWCKDTINPPKLKPPSRR
jgi:hypothetical protein